MDIGWILILIGLVFAVIGAGSYLYFVFSEKEEKEGLFRLSIPRTAGVEVTTGTIFIFVVGIVLIVTGALRLDGDSEEPGQAEPTATVAPEASTATPTVDASPAATATVAPEASQTAPTVETSPAAPTATAAPETSPAAPTAIPPRPPGPVRQVVLPDPAPGELVLTNFALGQTTDPNPEGQLTYVGPDTPVFASASGSGRLIVEGTNIVSVEVVDNDQDRPGFEMSNGHQLELGSQGDTDEITLFLEGLPQEGVDNIFVYQSGTASRITNLRITDLAFPALPGFGTVTVQLISGAPPDGPVDIEFQVEHIDAVTVRAISNSHPSGVNVVLEETDPTSGIFRGSLEIRGVGGSPQDSSLPGGAARLPAGDGIVMLSYSDPASGTDDDFAPSGQVLVDGSAPEVAIEFPAHGTAMQNLRPFITGTASDSGTGVDPGSLALVIDLNDDPQNSSPVFDSNGAISNPANMPASVRLSQNQLDPLLFRFEYAPQGDLISSAAAQTFAHVIDYQVTVRDYAGNIAFSDADLTGVHAASPGGRFQANFIRLDRKRPQMVSAKTGAGTRSEIEVIFDEELTAGSVQPSDFMVELDSGAQLAPVSSVYEYAEGFGARVALTMSSPVPSDDTPNITIVDAISDLAGNTTSSGSVDASDRIPPAVNIVLSGGSSASNPTGKTSDRMTITVTTDEFLAGAPQVEIYVEIYDADGERQGQLAVISQGSNTWIATFRAAGHTDGVKSVVVEATDLSGNNTVEGSPAWRDQGAIFFLLDRVNGDT